MLQPSWPVWDHDPFLQYRPFPATPHNNFEAHWHEIAGTVLFYVLVQRLLGPVARYCLGSTYTLLAKRTRVNFDVHVVSMVQSLVSILALVPMWHHPLWANHRANPSGAILGYTPYAGLVALVTVGYFVWDVCVCVRHFSLFGWGFLFHAVAAGYVFACALNQFCMPWMPAFLLFELSTPFVNINWFASKLPAGSISNAATLVNGLLLLVVFFVVRIVWGLYAVYTCALDMMRVWRELGAVLPTLILLLNMLLNALNAYWFYRMVLIARKRAAGSEKKR